VSVAIATVRRARRRTQLRTRVVLAVLTTLLVLALGARVLLGDFTVTLPGLVRILAGEQLPGATYIVLESKLPRAVLAGLVGVAFGTAGSIFQTVLRNPLASPDLIGVSTGASAAAVFAIVVLGQTGAAVSVAAVAGAVAVAALVRIVAGGVAGHRLVLVGVGIGAALQAVIQYLFTRADTFDAQLALWWLTGSVSRADWSSIRLLTVVLVVLLPAVIVLAKSLRVVELGSELATGLGVPARRAELLLVLAVLLTAVAVAAAGPVAFVAFLASPIARALNAGRATIAGAAMTGAAVVVAADYAADYLLADVNYPVGVVTGALGAPFLLWLLATGRTGRRAS